MKKSSTRRLLLSLGLALAAPIAVAAQESVETDVQPVDEVQEWFAEYQQVHQQLENIQLEALQDPQLSAEQEQLGERIRQAMEAQDPTLPDRIARVEALEVEVQGAQQAGDAERLQQLFGEAQAIEEHFMTVQQAVVEEPEIANQIMAFQTKLEQKMAELNPSAAELIARFKELETKIQSAMTGGA